MVDVSLFKRNADAMREGAWVSPGPQYGDLEIKTRASDFRYTDARIGALRQAARRFGGEDRIPGEESSRISTEVLISKCLQDVRGLTEDGKPVSFDRFLEMIRDPAFGELNTAAFIAAAIVGTEQAAVKEDAAGN